MENKNPTAVEHEYSASEIQVLEGLEAVRKRPGMYIGSTSASGLHHLVYEIVDNSIDEALAGFCTEIQVSIEPGNIIRVNDNGRGIPVDIQPQTGRPALEVVYTVLHAGGKFGGGGYKVSGGLHGVGASVVNALSQWLEVRVHKNGNIYEMKFSRGDITQEMKIIGATDHTGTEVVFKPDPEMFEDTEYDYETLHTRMREEAFLNAGLTITIADRRGEETISDTMCYAGGIREFVSYINRNKTPIHDGVIYMAGSKEDAMAEVSLQYNDSYSEIIVSFANNVHTPEGGMHEEGFKRALTNALNAYGRRMKILKDDEKVTGEDCREGLTCVISVKLTEAQFEGQTKAKLGNSEIRTLVNAIVSEKLEEFLEENPAVGRAILEKALTASRAREAARKARESVRRKTGLESGQMPDKLKDCNERDPALTEIYIVEGDSAGGSATQGRDSRFQAILPLWGKMLNVEKARADKVYSNEKLIPVITALGAGIGEEFNPDKLRYHKIIIMADADVDGAHIRTLLLTFFFRFMRPLIEQGYVYSAVPPLYKITRGKQQRVAFDDVEREKIAAEMRGDNPNAKVEISRFKGLGEMDPHELWETTMNPETRTLRRITLEDAVKADEIFTILMGEKVEPRKEFIEHNAKYVVNLDI
ncbi:MAG TPA: DNA topoisomerase (ATP-hydrolyzing) subunit B [Candidatus Evtepia faecavium]|nr:DNA topoisomerase (ATP-hydrolyzing) subunit B [Candidatus Evtepia faecavium]